jgi:two-component system, OmpR family, sensor histidine kinase BaeS
MAWPRPRTSLTHSGGARIYATAIAVLLAIVVSAAVARRITAPLERVLAAMRARGAGDRDVRVSDVHEVGVLRELLEGFNAATDALDRQDRARRNLVADVAHELRTPVAVLRAGHEAMLDGITDPTPENLRSLHDEVLRLGRMIEDLQALAAAEAAALQLSLVPHDLAAIAGDAAVSMTELFETAGVSLISRLLEVDILCDYERMREVVTNLLTNAMKYTPAGGTVLLETAPVDKQQACLRVSDTGIGIAPDELPHVTERFFRGQQSAAMAAGSGIGLTILAELVRAHRGDLMITSEPGVGTEVTVTLPRATQSKDSGRGKGRT